MNKPYPYQPGDLLWHDSPCSAFVLFIVSVTPNRTCFHLSATGYGRLLKDVSGLFSIREDCTVLRPSQEPDTQLT